MVCSKWHLPLVRHSGREEEEGAEDDTRYLAISNLGLKP